MVDFKDKIVILTAINDDDYNIEEIKDSIIKELISDQYLEQVESGFWFFKEISLKLTKLWVEFLDINKTKYREKTIKILKENKRSNIDDSDNLNDLVLFGVLFWYIDTVWLFTYLWTGNIPLSFLMSSFNNSYDEIYEEVWLEEIEWGETKEHKNSDNSNFESRFSDNDEYKHDDFSSSEHDSKTNYNSYDSWESSYSSSSSYSD